jgi:tetratricopeptide (TPR) repeat protein
MRVEMNLPSPKWIVRIVVLLILLVMMVGNKQNNLHSLSPKQALNLYYKAKYKGNVELIKKLIYFPPGTTEEQKLAEAKSSSIGPNAGPLIKLVASRRKAKYGKIIDENTAEVGVVSRAGFLGFGQENPVAKVILKKDDNIWKYFDSKYNLPGEQLFEKLKDNPEDADLYYYYGFRIMSENPAKANRFFKKYYELEPDGFWVTPHFVKELEEHEYFENEMLTSLDVEKVPQNSPGRAVTYRKIGQFFVEKKDYKKAKLYYDKATEILKISRSPLSEERLTKAKQELELRLEGKYVDLLTELEQNPINQK